MSRLILVDDDEIFSDFIVTALMDAGHVVGHYNNGREALAGLRFRQPELLLLDCNMPEMSGIELLREIRRDKALFRIPILMLTGRTDQSDERIARFDGADDYLTKPIVVDELLWRVEDLLSRPVSNTSLRDWISPSNMPLGTGKRMAI